MGTKFAVISKKGTFVLNFARNGQSSKSFFASGLPEAPIASITLQNIAISFKENAKVKKPAMMSYLQPMKQKGLYLKNVDQVILKNVKITHYRGSPITRSNIGKITGRLAKEVL